MPVALGPVPVAPHELTRAAALTEDACRRVQPDVIAISTANPV